MQGMSSYAWGTERTKNERARIWRGELPGRLACLLQGDSLFYVRGTARIRNGKLAANNAG